MNPKERSTSEHLSREVLARALEAVKCGLLITNPAEFDNPIIYANPEFCEMTGYSVDEILGKNCRFLQARDRSQPELGEVRAAIHNLNSCTVIVRNYKKNGELFYNELTISPIRTTSGDVSHFVGIQKDVTSDLLLKQRSGEFVATLLHDVKTPLLAAVRLINYIMTSGPQATEQQKLLEGVLHNDRSLIRLIDNAIDCYRLESTEMAVNISHFELQPLLLRCVEELKFMAKQKTVKIIVFDGLITVSADFRLCERVIANLLDLAIQYAPVKGRLSVKVKAACDLVDIEISSRSSQLPTKFLSVKQELFLSRDEENGTRLALYLSKKILEKHGGSLIVARKNKVTTLTARFPRRVVQ